MKKDTCSFLLGCAAVLAALPAFAQSEDILENTSTFKPRITLSDVYSERVVVESEDGFVTRSVVAAPQRLSFSLTANLAAAEVGEINEETEVGLTAWKFSHNDVLGNAADYKPGARRATFPYTAMVDLPNGDVREVRVGSITYAWTPRQLTVTLTITDAEAAGVGDIAASDYVGIAEPGDKVVIRDDPVDVAVNFGAATGTRTVFLRGLARLVTRSFGQPTADDFETLDVAEVNVQGTADTANPVVSAAFPPRLSSNVLDVTGTVRDVQLVTITSVTVNNAPVQPLVSLWEPDETGLATWAIDGLELKRGVNVVAVTFADPDGNTTRVTRSYTVR